MDYGAGVSHIINMYTIEAYRTFCPTEWDFFGSNNGSSWTEIDSQTGLSFSLDEKKTFVISNATSYRYYKFEFVGGDNKGIREVELLYDEPQDFTGGVSFGSANMMEV
jgi:hypothetical protein